MTFMEYFKPLIDTFNSLFNKKNEVNTLFCICGETASGKDTLVNKIISMYPDHLRAVCSYSTRPKRDHEVEGVEHYFVSTDEFNLIKEQNEDKIIAYTKISSNENSDGFEYMALEDELQKSNIYIIDPNGIKYLKDKFKDNPNLHIITIYITTSLQNRINRARNRSDFDTEFKKRVMNEFEQFLDFNIENGFDYIIYNDDNQMGNSLQELEKIMIKQL